MALYKYIEPINLRSLLFYLCKLLMLFSVILIIPLVVSLIAGEFNLTIIISAAAFISLAVGYLGRKIGAEKLTVKEAVIITALSYLMFSLVSAFIFLPYATYFDGFFESISGFTTTGLTVFNADKLPDTLLFFRSYSQWIGGAGIIIITLVVLVGPGKSATKLFSSEFGKYNLVGDVKNTGMIVIKIYTLSTFIGYLAYLISGAGFFDSALMVLSTFSTGGFTPHAASTGYYNIPFLHIIIIIFMLVGATSFSTVFEFSKTGIKALKKNFELKYLIGIFLFFTILFYLAWGLKTDKIISSFFHSATALTTTGFSIEQSTEWTPAIKLLKIFLMITGGSTESTAGGIKILRIIMMFYLVRWVIYKLLLPQEAKVPVKIGSYIFKDSEIKKAFSFFAVYILILFVSTLLFTYQGYNILDAVFENASALGTVGLSTGITNGELSPFLKTILMIEMWAGRLEIFPLFALLYPRVWFKRGD